MSRLIVLAAGLLPASSLLGAGPIVAQSSVSAQASAANSEIVVTGTRNRSEEIQNFIEEITVEADGDQLAAFQSPICAHVAGLPDLQARFVEARVMDIADTVGARADSPGCSPNLLVLFAIDIPAVMAELNESRPELFAGMTTAQKRRLLDSADAVRSWNVLDIRGSDGREMERISQVCYSPVWCRPVDGHMLTGVEASRIRRSTRSDLAVSILVVDLGAFQGATLQQLADYSAMRTLARTEVPESATQTILTLLDDLREDRASEPEATRWDLGYLRALYATDRTVSANSQQSAMRRSVQHTLDTEPETFAAGPAAPIRRGRGNDGRSVDAEQNEGDRSTRTRNQPQN